jgi:adenosylmethionine-8-amino-7-oxononanoate aminotransferase
MTIDTMAFEAGLRAPVRDDSETRLDTAALQQLDSAHFLHPFTDHGALSAKGARVMVRGEGIYLWDSDGHKIIDGMSGLWCVNVGYGRTSITQAVARQMDVLPFYNSFFNTTNVPAVKLADKLAGLAPPGFEHVFFTSSGSEANDTALRMVWRYWQLMGLLAADWLEQKILELGPDRVAAFIGEPVQGAGGVVIPPQTYWPQIQRICDKYGILLISDEVICGFGRLGTWFGSERMGMRPDLIPFAKGVTSGYVPLGGVLVGERVARALIERGGDFNHGFTYSGHPVACAAALENLRIIEEEKLVDRVARETGPHLKAAFTRLAEHPLVGHAESIGMAAGLNLVRRKAATLHDCEPFARDLAVGMVCRQHMFDNGVIMRAVGDRMIVAPPLVMTCAQIDEMVERIGFCLDRTLADIANRGWLD